jgi:hypothetical protein
MSINQPLSSWCGPIEDTDTRKKVQTPPEPGPGSGGPGNVLPDGGMTPEVAPPPSTETCPDNTALDANGNCAPVTQTPKEPKSSDDNKPSKPKLPKGSGVLEQPQRGESTAKKGNG